MKYENEIWKPVVGWEGFYEISNYGRVKSLPREIVDKNGQVRHLRMRILRPFMDYHGQRPVVNLSKNGSPGFKYVDVMQKEAFG